MQTLTAIFEQDGDFWIGYVEELSGANTQGRTLDEARINLKEAVELIIKCNRDVVRREYEGKDIIRETIHVEV